MEKALLGYVAVTSMMTVPGLSKSISWFMIFMTFTLGFYGAMGSDGCISNVPCRAHKSRLIERRVLLEILAVLYKSLYCRL
jgi:hypothetical protein